MNKLNNLLGNDNSNSWLTFLGLYMITVGLTKLIVGIVGYMLSRKS